MEDKLNYDEFEEFLQDQVRNQRMYPSDGVWREIDKKLHGEKRWPALTIAAVMLVSATVLICVYFTPKPDIFSVQTTYANNSTPDTTTLAASKNSLLDNLSAPVPFAKERVTAPGLIPNTFPELITKNQETVSYTKPVKIVTQKEITTNTSSIVSVVRIKAQHNTKGPITVNSGAAVQAMENNLINSNVEKSTISNSTTSPVDNEIADKNAKPSTSVTHTEFKQESAVDNLVRNRENKSREHYTNKKINLKNSFSYLIYFAPSVSYRKLFEDNSLLKENNGGPVGLNYVTDVNKVVRHKPGTGIEAGISLLYHLSNKVRVKSGFQFNMRQYSINAYRSSTELASIALVGTNRIDTVNTLAIYRNNNGYYSAELVNRYYQISIPSGIEWEVVGNKRIQLNVAGTIQPTYLLNRNAYLLSTNFKNYTENPGMVRQWNINSNIEAFMSFKVGDFKWQLGPQLRYQPYSTFIRQYPIKEHLLDYGVKLGLSKTIY